MKSDEGRRLLSCQIQSLLPVMINHEVVAGSSASYMFLLGFHPAKRGSSWCKVSDSPVVAGFLASVYKFPC